jgi:hypothetical protein
MHSYITVNPCRMNEIQIIQKQLATERAHFSEIAQLCAAAGTSGTSFAAACTDYFGFAVTRFEPSVAERLAAALAEGTSAGFLSEFAQSSQAHFEKLDALLARNLPVTEWRAISRIDADSIFAERARYARVKAALPT